MEASMGMCEHTLLPTDPTEPTLLHPAHSTYAHPHIPNTPHLPGSSHNPRPHRRCCPPRRRAPAGARDGVAGVGLGCRGVHIQEPTTWHTYV
eukprot:364351-Chlamydomonas_euryale.AAC.2